MDYPQPWLSVAGTITRRIGMDEATSLSLLKAAQAPGDLVALAMICTNLTTILPIVKDLAALDPGSPSPGPDQISDWLTVCREISEGRRIYDALAPGIAANSGKGKLGPIYGRYQEYPIYAALWYLNGVRPENRTAFAILLAHMVLACYRLAEEFGPATHLAEKRHASKAARYFVEQAPKRILPPRLTSDHLPAETYCTFLRSISGPGTPKIARIATLIEHSIDGRAQGTRSPLERARIEWPALDRPATVFSADTMPIDDSGDDAAGPRRATEKLAAFAEQDHQQWCRSGCSPDEATAGVEFFTYEHEADDHIAGRRARDHVVRTRRVMIAAAMDNQIFPTAWDSLTGYETAILLSSIEALSGQDSGAESESTSGNLELAALLAATFWTGRPIENLLNCPVRTKSAARETSPIVYIHRAIHSYWSVVPAKPNARQKLTMEAAVQAVPTAERLALQTRDGTCAEAIINRYIETPSPIGLRGRIMFPSGITSEANRFRKTATTYLRSLNKRHGTRLTLGRMSTFLFRRIAVRSGSDATVASMITGREHPIARTPLHYASLPTTRLEKSYAEESATLIHDLRQESAYAHSRGHSLSHDKSSNFEHIGSRWRPTLACVQGLEKGLSNRLEEAWKIRNRVQRAIEVHNAITLYTHWLIAFATGYRAVRRAFVHETEIDRESGFAVISDKDAEDFYHTRLVWLPPMVIAQISNWRMHWKFFKANRLREVNPKLHQALVEERKPSRRRRAASPTTPRNVTAGVEGLFRFRDGGEVVPLRPRNVSEATGAMFRLPPNAGRHYLRSRLFEENCPAEVIAAFMGHWERGEEPWNRYSGISPVDYRDALAPVLRKIIKEGNWRPRHGFRR